MTVALTGDVHHLSLSTRDQEHMTRTEVETAIDYAETAAEYDLPVTLFVTGKAVAEEREQVGRLARMDNVELGGHNYYAFGTLAHKAFRGLTGSWHGPKIAQGWEIDRTLGALDEVGAEVRAWRDHAYRHDGNTADLLADRDITHFSDAVGPDEPVRREDGLTVVPINTPPDHEHVYHAFRTPEFVAQDDFEGPFGTESRAVAEWVDWVWEHVEQRTAAGQPATILAHPACMWLADEQAAFGDLCARLAASDHEVVKLSAIEP